MWIAPRCGGLPPAAAGKGFCVLARCADALYVYGWCKRLSGVLTVRCRRRVVLVRTFFEFERCASATAASSLSPL